MSDANRLEAALQGLVGKTCWFAEFDAPGNLLLHFGSPRKQWHLTVAKNTPWEIEKPNGAAITSDDPNAEAHLGVLEEKVEAVVLDPEVFGLFLLFNTGFSLHAVPALDDGLREGGPSWEIEVPDNGTVKVGPGKRWRVEGASD